MSALPSPSNKNYGLLPWDVEGFGALAELALDLRWSWNHYADSVWRQLDPALWERTQNPWIVLQSVSRDKLKNVLAVNGGINLSELDGWWAEAYAPEVGWVLGDGQEHGDDPAWDATEAEALYDLLEREVIPEFYARDQSGIPTAWVKRTRESMARLTPRFSANRAVREYTEQHYLPAAAAYRERAANTGAMGKQMVDWEHTLDQNWDALRFGDLRVETNAGHHVFEVEFSLNDLDPNAVRVELYADGISGGDPVREEMC